MEEYHPPCRKLKCKYVYPIEDNRKKACRKIDYNSCRPEIYNHMLVNSLADFTFLLQIRRGILP